MKLKIILVTFGLFIGSTGLALAQMQPQVIGGPTPLTPEQNAIYMKGAQLEGLAEAALNDEHYVLAESDAQACLALGPGNFGGLAKPVLAAALAAQGRVDDSLKVYAQLYAGGEWHPDEMLPYALLLVSKGEWTNAVDAYERCLPNFGSSLVDGHQLLVDESQFAYDDPEPAYLEADIRIAMGFSNIRPYSLNGPDTPEQDLTEYQRALDLEPDSPLANLAYAHGLEMVGRRKDALALFRSAASKYTGGARSAARRELGEAPDPPTTGTSK